MPTIAYLGPEHTNTHLAAQKRFGRRARYIHAPTVDDVFRFVERGQANFGVVPIENSLEGAVTHTLDRFAEKASSVRIVGEVEFSIQHYLIVKPGTVPAAVQRVYSHPQALAQCRKWIAGHLATRCALEERSSTAEAVELVASKATEWGIETAEQVIAEAAIGSREAAQKFQLAARPIRVKGDNKTRFLMLGRQKPKPGRFNKTSVLFGVKDRPGALYDALIPFKQHRINLTKIESRPSKRKAWEYLFFIDLEGHISEPRVKRALQALGRSTSLLRVLGSYPISGR